MLHTGEPLSCYKKDNTLAMGCDGQVTLGDTVIKSQAVKLRKVYNDKVMTVLPVRLLMH
jgi:ATP-dependent HslUV protease subunit HslV